MLLEIVPLQTIVGQNTARVAGDCLFTDYSGSKYCTCCWRLSLYRLKWVKILHVSLEIVPLRIIVGQNTARVAGDCPFTDYSGSKYCTCRWRLSLYGLKWVKILHVSLEIVPLQTKVGQNTARVAGDCPCTD